jgi:hypothetical protein
MPTLAASRSQKWPRKNSTSTGPRQPPSRPRTPRRLPTFPRSHLRTSSRTRLSQGGASRQSEVLAAAGRPTRTPPAARPGRRGRCPSRLPLSARSRERSGTDRGPGVLCGDAEERLVLGCDGELLVGDYLGADDVSVALRVVEIHREVVGRVEVSDHAVAEVDLVEGLAVDRGRSGRDAPGSAAAARTATEGLSPQTSMDGGTLGAGRRGGRRSAPPRDAVLCELFGEVGRVGAGGTG